MSQYMYPLVKHIPSYDTFIRSCVKKKDTANPGDLLLPHTSPVQNFSEPRSIADEKQCNSDFYLVEVQGTMSPFRFSSRGLET